MHQSTQCAKKYPVNPSIYVACSMLELGDIFKDSGTAQCVDTLLSMFLVIL
jgi:hypothetical protein